MAGRPAAAPARHWPDRPEVIAGRDLVGGGSWFGVNESGVFAALLNRTGTLGSAPGKRSRGELVLDALDYADAAEAAAALADLDPAAWRGFNLVIADDRDAILLVHDGARLTGAPIPPGLHLLRHGRLNDPDDPVLAAFLPRFAAAPTPTPSPEGWRTADWAAWRGLLAWRDPAPGLCFLRPDGYGTRSASLLALPDLAGSDPGAPRFHYWHADGPPDQTPFVAVPG